MNIKTLITAAMVVLGSAWQPLNAQGVQDFRNAYERNKPSPGGISPSTRSEYATCMAAWGVWGAFTVADPKLASRLHPDFNERETNWLYSHWWDRAEDAYGWERAERFSSDLQKAESQINNQLAEQNMMPTLITLGNCYVAPKDRSNGNARISVRKLYETRNSIVQTPAELREFMVPPAGAQPTRRAAAPVRRTAPAPAPARPATRMERIEQTITGRDSNFMRRQIEGSLNDECYRRGGRSRRTSSGVTRTKRISNTWTEYTVSGYVDCILPNN